MSHESILTYYEINFALMQHHHYSLSELEDMWPFEREIYLSLLKKWLREQKEKNERRKNRRR